MTEEEKPTVGPEQFYGEDEVGPDYNKNVDLTAVVESDPDYIRDEREQLMHRLDQDAGYGRAYGEVVESTDKDKSALPEAGAAKRVLGVEGADAVSVETTKQDIDHALEELDAIMDEKRTTISPLGMQAIDQGRKYLEGKRAALKESPSQEATQPVQTHEEWLAEQARLGSN